MRWIESAEGKQWIVDRRVKFIAYITLAVGTARLIYSMVTYELG